MFPKTIYFCNKTLDRMEENSNKWKWLNPKYNIELYDDTMCEAFLLNEYSKLHRDIFRFLKDGPIKACFWRMCILYKYGGVYSDIDVEPFIPLDTFIEEDSDLVTCFSSWDKHTFNPTFIVAKNNNIILKKCIEWYINKYKRKEKYDYWNWSSPIAFNENLILDNYNKDWGVYYSDSMKVQMLQENKGGYDAHAIYYNIRIFNSRSANWDWNSHSFLPDMDSLISTALSEMKYKRLPS